MQFVLLFCLEGVCETTRSKVILNHLLRLLSSYLNCSVKNLGSCWEHDGIHKAHKCQLIVKGEACISQETYTLLPEASMLHKETS